MIRPSRIDHQATRVKVRRMYALLRVPCGLACVRVEFIISVSFGWRWVCRMLIMYRENDEATGHG